MKTKTILAVLIIGITTLGCQKNQTDINSDVENYISLLKSNSYESEYLPDFKPEHIPALLKHINDTLLISNYPHNPISSLHGSDCKLGVLVLWTIESIRKTEINGKKHPMNRYPSLNPVLKSKDSNEPGQDKNNNSQRIAAMAYYSWWNTIIPFEQLKSVDPLDQTNLDWF